MHRARSFLLLPLCLLSALAALCCNSMGAQGKGTVDGLVLCADGNTPGREATVRLIPIEQLLLATEDASKRIAVDSKTDLAGRFIFEDVPEGTYILQAKRPGYSDDLDLVRLALPRLKPEQRREIVNSFPQAEIHGGTSVRQNIVIRRAGAISGKVLADDNGTLVATAVTARLLSSPVLGAVTEGVGFERYATTDDRGVFRIAGLPTGRYLLSVRLAEDFLEVSVAADHTATMRAKRIGTGHLEVFAPSALTREDATPVALGEGDELRDVDIDVPFRKLHSIGGHTLEAGQKPVPGILVSIQRKGRKPIAYEAVSDSTGSYRIDLLPPGTYTLEAKGPARTDGKPRTSSGAITAELTTFDKLDVDVSVSPGVAAQKP